MAFKKTGMEGISSLGLERWTGSSDRPARILFEELRRFRPLFAAMNIGFFVSRARVRIKDGELKKPPYFACRYDAGSLEGINILAVCYPLIADWSLLDDDVEQYRKRICSALREEMIHATQVLTVKKRYEKSDELRRRFVNAETYYNYLLGQIIEELARTQEGENAVLTAAKLYYEDWAISSFEELQQADRKFHGRHGYSVNEIIRQAFQIRFGELTSEEAKGKAWDKHRLFFVGEYGTTENLLKAMASRLRQAVPYLINSSPTLSEALIDIERRLQEITDRHADLSFRAAVCR
jgi:hypothetical protein